MSFVNYLLTIYLLLILYIIVWLLSIEIITVWIRWRGKEW